MTTGNNWTFEDVTINISGLNGNKSEGQKWYLKNLSNGYVTLTSALGEYMLDINGAEDKDGTNVELYSSHSGEAQ